MNHSFKTGDRVRVTPKPGWEDFWKGHGYSATFAGETGFGTLVLIRSDKTQALIKIDPASLSPLVEQPASEVSRLTTAERELLCLVAAHCRKLTGCGPDANETRAKLQELIVKVREQAAPGA